MMNIALPKDFEVALTLDRGVRTYSVEKLIAMAEKYEAEEDLRKKEEKSVPTSILVRGIKVKVEFSKIDWKLIEAPRPRDAFRQRDCQERMLQARAAAESNMEKYGEFELELPEPPGKSWESYIWGDMKKLAREKATCEADWVHIFLLFAQFISSYSGKYSSDMAWETVNDITPTDQQRCWIITWKDGNGVYIGGWDGKDAPDTPSTITATRHDYEKINFAEPIFVHK